MIDLNNITEKQLCSMIDHTLLKADATDNDFRLLCDQAKQYGFAMVAINSYPVKLCKEFLKDTDIHVGAAISFPLGAMTIDSKIAETSNAIRDGADEIDYVVNISRVRQHDYEYIKDEMKQLVELCRNNNTTIKVIFENCYLNNEEIKQLCLIANEIKPDYIKTSTGFGIAGAKLEDVRLMKQYIDDDIQIKAAGGIRDWSTCKKMIEAGATRIGTSSSIRIVEEFIKDNNNQILL